MYETKRLCSAGGFRDKKSVSVEIGFRQNVVLKVLHVDRRTETTKRGLRSPDFNEQRRVGISEWSYAMHVLSSALVAA